MKPTIPVLIATLIATALPVFAQGPGPSDRRPGRDMPLFPPELVMRHAQALDLGEEQRETIIAEIQKMQSGVVPIEWELREQTQVLQEILAAYPVDERAALERIERVHDLELQIKKQHMGLLIRIKNLLSDAQRAELEELRRHAPRRGRGMPPHAPLPPHD